MSIGITGYCLGYSLIYAFYKLFLILLEVHLLQYYYSLDMYIICVPIYGVLYLDSLGPLDKHPTAFMLANEKPQLSQVKAREERQLRNINRPIPLDTLVIMNEMNVPLLPP